jgi:hypothetical protein
VSDDDVPVEAGAVGDSRLTETAAVDVAAGEAVGVAARLGVRIVEDLEAGDGLCLGTGHIVAESFH